MSRKEPITIMVIGPHPSRPGETDIIEMIERVPSGTCLTLVRYKGKQYPVWGRKGSERIFVGIHNQEQKSN